MGQGDQGTRSAVWLSPSWAEVAETAALIDQHLGPIVAKSFEDRLLLCQRWQTRTQGGAVAARQQGKGGHTQA